MAETSAADRDRVERERVKASGSPGILFSHATSVQGNPMRAADWRSSSRYHRKCAMGPVGEDSWSDRIPSH